MGILGTASRLALCRLFLGDHQDDDVEPRVCVRVLGSLRVHVTCATCVHECVLFGPLKCVFGHVWGLKVRICYLGSGALEGCSQCNEDYKEDLGIGAVCHSSGEETASSSRSRVCPYSYVSLMSHRLVTSPMAPCSLCRVSMSHKDVLVP